MTTKKTPATIYWIKKLVTLSLFELENELLQAPISDQERNFLFDIRARMSLKELAEKYNLSQSGIAKKKRKLFLRLYSYDMSQLMH